MNAYEIKRYDSLSAYRKDDLDQCTPVVITEEHMTTYLLRVHCDDFVTALIHFCEVFANENVDWEPVVDYILEQDKYSNFWIGFTGDFSYVFVWAENGFCKVTIIFYRWNILTDETEQAEPATTEDKTETNEETKEETMMDEIKKLNLNQLVKRLHELSFSTEYEADPIKRDEMRKEEQMIRNHLEEFEKWSGMSVKYRIFSENGTLYDCYYLEPKGGDA